MPVQKGRFAKTNPESSINEGENPVTGSAFKVIGGFTAFLQLPPRLAELHTPRTIA
jgi:hypothetical protein